MYKTYLILGTFLSGLAVALGAFGAHGLKKLVGPETVATYQTGVQYQMWHALALIVVAMLYERWHSSLFGYSAISFITGIILFSGSLYLIASMKAMNKVTPTAVGILTPIGGLFFILGWVLLLIAIVRK